ncbi:MAG: pantoate--beta-alanine ligase [Bryobacterales bacterium]|nr:pantoate--beta-alanine ligase [Acidobacteriota bacterium]MCB9383930.1 pantoate--beta-alanine ligase [Bryobacterales bacterium]
MRRRSREARRKGENVGLVPTLGALHAGHRTLIDRAREECDFSAVTLFVNPTQFNQAADLAQYPRTFEQDLAMCEEAGVDCLFAPSAEEMYPQPGLAHVEVAELTGGLCGKFRPGHFRGVTTVVAKLFHIAEPDRAYFGEKDFQQLAVIRRMVRDLDFAVEIVGVPTVREFDGLALSSRNARLSGAEREAATVLSRALRLAADAVRNGEQDVESIRELTLEAIADEPLARPEYVEIVDPETLAPVARVEREARLVLAVWVGEVRLIDNASLRPA